MSSRRRPSFESQPPALSLDETVSLLPKPSQPSAYLSHSIGARGRSSSPHVGRFLDSNEAHPSNASVLSSSPRWYPMSPALSALNVPERGKLMPDTKSYWGYYLPAMEWIPQYKAKYLLGDIMAGLTLASFQIPIVMSYATSLAHVSTISGLYGLVVPPFVYAVMGSVPTMVIGPEAAISLVLGQATAPLIHNKSGEGVTPDAVSGLMAGTAGAVLLIGGLLRFGFLDSVLSRALLRGFISAVGVVMVVDQLPSELGITEKMHSAIGTHASVYSRVMYMIAHGGHEAHRLTAVVAFTAFLSIVIFRLIKATGAKKAPRIIFLPEILIVVITSTIITNVMNLDESGLDVVGDINPGKVEIKFPINPENWEVFKSSFSASFFCAILGFFESTIASKSIAASQNISISTNRELVALGVANIVGSLVCALPSFGGYGRSKINALSGARTQISCVVLCLVTILSIAFLMPYFYYLPRCVLSAVISVVGLSLIEEAPRDIKFYWQIGGYEDLFTLLLTFLGTIFLSVEAGIAIGVGFSVIRVIHHATPPRIQILGRVPGTNIFENADRLVRHREDQVEEIAGCLIVKIPEPLTFANTGDLRNRLRRLEVYGTMNVHPSHPPIRQGDMTRQLVMDLHGMTECDSSAVQVLLEIVSSYVSSRGIPVYLARVPQIESIRRQFQLAGITDLVTKRTNDLDSVDDIFFGSIDEALRYISKGDSEETRV